MKVVAAMATAAAVLVEVAMAAVTRAVAEEAAEGSLCKVARRRSNEEAMHVGKRVRCGYVEKNS